MQIYTEVKVPTASTDRPAYCIVSKMAEFPIIYVFSPAVYGIIPWSTSYAVTSRLNLSRLSMSLR